MIYESSKDYGTGVITMIFEGKVPDYAEVNEYCYVNYGFYPTFYYKIESVWEVTDYAIHAGVITVPDRRVAE